MDNFVWAAAATVIAAGAVRLFLLYKPAKNAPNAPAPIASLAAPLTTAAPEPAAAEGAEADPAQAQSVPAGPMQAAETPAAALATAAPTASTDQGKPSGNKAKS